MEEFVQTTKTECAVPKRISIMVPTYNEEENVIPLTEAIVAEFARSLPQYDYDITFIDNCSPTQQERNWRHFVPQIRVSAPFSTCVTLGNSTPRITVFARQRGIAPFRCALIFRILLK